MAKLKRLKYNSDYMSDKMDSYMEQIEDKLSALYADAAKEMQDKLSDFMEGFEKQDANMQAQVEAGKVTQEEYSQWRNRHIVQSDKYKSTIDSLSTMAVNADVAAMAMVNGAMPMVVAQSYNFTQALGFEAADKAGLTQGTFQIYNARSVQKLIKDNPNLLKEVDMDADKKWNTEKMNREITQGIIQGEPMEKIADRLQRVTDMDRNAAVRNARTMMTGAENMGRAEAADDLKAQGIPMDEVWSATYDNRTRESHLELDGTVRDENGYFGADFLAHPLRYPADPLGDPEEIYNCRCRLSLQIVGIDHSKDQELYENFMKDNFPQTWETMQEKDSIKNALETYSKKQEEMPPRPTKEMIPPPEKVSLEDIKEEPSYPVATNREEATMIVEGLFSDISRGIKYVDDDVYVASINKISELESRFHAINRGDGSRMSLTTSTNFDGIAEVTSSIGNIGSESLVLNLDHYSKDVEYWERKTGEAIENRWWMPASSEDRTAVTIAHEYGHIVENQITNTIEFARESLAVYEADKSEDKENAVAWCTQQLEQKRDNIREEIIAIAMEANPEFDLEKNISRYGKSSSGEFFAECFMNSQMGNPNELGKAMSVWLERQGL